MERVPGPITQSQTRSPAPTVLRGHSRIKVRHHPLQIINAFSFLLQGKSEPVISASTRNPKTLSLARSLAKYPPDKLRLPRLPPNPPMSLLEGTAFAVVRSELRSPPLLLLLITTGRKKVPGLLPPCLRPSTMHSRMLSSNSTGSLTKPSLPPLPPLPPPILSLEKSMLSTLLTEWLRLPLHPKLI